MNAKDHAHLQSLVWRVKKIAEQLTTQAASTYENCYEDGRAPTPAEVALLDEQSVRVTDALLALTRALDER